MKYLIFLLLVICAFILFSLYCAKFTKFEQEKYNKEMFMRFVIERLKDKSILNDSERFNKLVDELYQIYKKDYREAIKRIDNLIKQWKTKKM